MLRPFLLTSAVLCFMLLALTVHAFKFNSSEHTKELKNMALLSNLHVMSLSTSEHEPRMRYYERASNIAYPELLPIDTMSYIYE